LWELKKAPAYAPRFSITRTRAIGPQGRNVALPEAQTDGLPALVVKTEIRWGIRTKAKCGLEEIFPDRDSGDAIGSIDKIRPYVNKNTPAENPFRNSPQALHGCALVVTMAYRFTS